jgi:hypothetical protein
MADEMGLGISRRQEIELVGDEALFGRNFGFRTKRSFVIWGDQMLRRGPLRFLEKILLHSPLVFWAPLASNIYHDWLWYPTVGRSIIRGYDQTPWGRLFQHYRRSGTFGGAAT